MASYKEQLSSDRLEKRMIPRFPVQLPAQLGTDVGDISSICTNLSSKGLSVETSKNLYVGERVSVQVMIAPKQPPLRMLGQVVWKQDSVALDPSEKPVTEIGIRFVKPLNNAWKLPGDEPFSNFHEEPEYSDEMPF